MCILKIYTRMLSKQRREGYDNGRNDMMTIVRRYENIAFHGSNEGYVGWENTISKPVAINPRGNLVTIIISWVFCNMIYSQVLIREHVAVKDLHFILFAEEHKNEFMGKILVKTFPDFRW